MSTSTILPVIHPIHGNIHPESLAHLHTAIVDAIHGIDHLAGHGGAEVTPVLAEFRDMHEDHDRQLAEEMARHGHPPNEEGRFHHLLQSGKERLRDMFAGGESKPLERLLDSERHVIEAYNAALEEGGPNDVIELLQHQREELGNLLIRHDSRLASGTARA